MLKIVSMIDWAIPAARSAANDEPYSISRRSPRCHQTRCGIRCTSGPAPVTIDERQTGVREGKTDVACLYVPCSARKPSAGARPLSTARSNAAGVIPSTRIRTSFLVTGERAQARVALGRAPPDSRSQQRERERLAVAEHG